MLDCCHPLALTFFVVTGRGSRVAALRAGAVVLSLFASDTGGGGMDALSFNFHAMLLDMRSAFEVVAQYY